MASLDESVILELGTVPIPGGAPCGVDAAEDELYIAVMAEMPKLDRIDADEPDWMSMTENATKLLRTKSKDIEIASAMGHALFKKHSYAGLAAALGMLDGMVRQSWDDTFPKRPRRRKARIEALASRFVDGQWLRDNPPKPSDFDGLDLCVARAESLKAAITERMPDDPPDFRKFLDGLKGHASQRPKPAASAAPPASTTSPAADPNASASATVPGGASMQPVGEIEHEEVAKKAILNATAFLRKKDPTNPVPYAAMRALKWSGFKLPTNENAKFKIPPPESSLVTGMSQQFSNQSWAPLLGRAEGAFRAGHPLWLDLQRYICGAMEGLGPTYENARLAVLAQTSELVSRLGDGLFELRFSDDTPLCSGETKLWIESVASAKKPEGGGGSAASAGSAGSNGLLTQALEKARKLTSSGKIREAILELQTGQSACTQRRDRFLWKFRIAELCLDAQRVTLAAPLLEELFAEIERFHISEWEPSLAVQVAQALYRCRKAAMKSQKSPSPEALAGIRDSFAWLCQLDPLAALAVEPKAK